MGAAWHVWIHLYPLSVSLHGVNRDSFTFLLYLYHTFESYTCITNLTLGGRILPPLRDSADTTTKARALSDSFVTQKLRFAKSSRSVHAVTLLTCMRTVFSSIPGRTADYPVRFPRLTFVTSRSTPKSAVNYTTNTSSNILSKPLIQVCTPYHLGAVCGLW
jgi:hypothetical protein